MNGISSKAARIIENKKKFNGIEHTTDFDLNQYDAFFRTLDPQVGRWWMVDPKVDSMFSWSPYVSMFDNPVRFIDPLGDVPGDSTKTQQSYHPAPKTLPGFPEAGKRVYNKESGRYRWKLKDGTILEWDKQHGEVEKYDKTGKNHLGSFDPKTGEELKPGNEGRSTSKFVSLFKITEPVRMIHKDYSLFKPVGAPLNPFGGIINLVRVAYNIFKLLEDETTPSGSTLSPSLSF